MQPVLTWRCTRGPGICAVAGGSPARSCPMLRISRHSTCERQAAGFVPACGCGRGNTFGNRLEPVQHPAHTNCRVQRVGNMGQHPALLPAQTLVKHASGARLRLAMPPSRTSTRWLVMSCRWRVTEPSLSRMTCSNRQGCGSVSQRQEGRRLRDVGTSATTGLAASAGPAWAILQRMTMHQQLAPSKKG